MRSPLVGSLFFNAAYAAGYLALKELSTAHVLPFVAALVAASFGSFGDVDREPARSVGKQLTPPP